MKAWTLAALATAVAPLPAAAEDQSPEAGFADTHPADYDDPGADAGQEDTEPLRAGATDDDRFPFGVHLSGSGAVQNTALAAALGFRYRINEHWLIGADGEYNPWISQRSGEIRRGVVNAYATVILRFPMAFERINLRSSLHLGASRMMFDLFGAPEGSIGPYIGFNLLGLDYEMAEQLYLVVDPADIAIPIPQTSGTPFVYPQYRVTIGLQWGA